MAMAVRLSDHDLLRRVAELAGRERQAAAELIGHLAELDRRKLYREQGYGSLFSYCTEALHLSEHATFNRIEAARASRSFPVILDRLADGAVNLSTVRLLAPHLTPGNHVRLLAEAAGRSKREVEAIVARLAPQPAVPGSVRKLPAPATPRAVPAEALAVAAGAGAAPLPSGPPVRPPSCPPMPTQRLVAPLAPDRYRILFTVSRETREKLRHVQDLLRREIPDGDLGAIFDRALTLLMEDVARRKLAAARNPRPHRAAHPGSRHVPAEVKRKVWLRDHGQCAFVSPAGRRCRQRAFLEFHHIDPYALGGATSVANVSLRCREHNVHEAVLAFGPWGPAAVREGEALYSTWEGTAPKPQRHVPHSPRGEWVPCRCRPPNGRRTARAPW